MYNEQQLLTVVNDLSNLIMQELYALSGEYWQPRLMADQSDSEMQFRRERIEHLRAMRLQFENVMCGMPKE